MITIDSGIEFDFPDTWEQFSDGSRRVFHTPRREEIIVSATRLSGDGSAAERADALEVMFANGVESMRRGASHPDLRVTKPLAEESDVCVFRCATVLAQTTARDAFFAQAVIQHLRGIVFLTYEAPFVDGAEGTFRDLLGMVYEQEGSG